MSDGTGVAEGRVDRRGARAAATATVTLLLLASPPGLPGPAQATSASATGFQPTPPSSRPAVHAAASCPAGSGATSPAAAGSQRCHRRRVRDAVNGRPIRGATLAYSDATGSVTVHTADRAGRFGAAPEGAVLVSVGAAGWLTQTGAVPLPEGDILLGRDPDPTDPDSDGLTNGNEAAGGTDPAAADSDGDGIGDAVEATVTAPFGAPALGADPLRKTVFAEIWYDERSALKPAQLDAMQAMFAAGPVANPDGSTGIDLVVDVGAFGGGGLVTDPAADPDCDPTLAALRDSGRFRPEREPYFFYAWGDADLTSICGYNGLATWERTHVFDGEQGTLYGTIGDLIEWGTWAHEIGHNFGLTHAGGPTTEGECKVNYPSVMNYNTFLAGGFTYSSGDLPALDENALDEQAGIPYVDPFFGVSLAIPLDWNHNGVIDTEPVSADINNMLIWDGLSPLLQPYVDLVYAVFPTYAGRCPADGDLQVLEDHDDWAYLEANLASQVGPAAP